MRKWGIWLGVAALVVVAAWSGFWLYVRGQVSDQIRASLAQLEATGLSARANQISVGGYPFSWVGTVSGLTLERAGRFRVTAPDLTAGVSLAALDRVTIGQRRETGVFRIALPDPASPDADLCFELTAVGAEGGVVAQEGGAFTVEFDAREARLAPVAGEGCQAGAAERAADLRLTQLRLDGRAALDPDPAQAQLSLAVSAAELEGASRAPALRGEGDAPARLWAETIALTLDGDAGALTVAAQAASIDADALAVGQLDAANLEARAALRPGEGDTLGALTAALAQGRGVEDALERAEIEFEVSAERVAALRYTGPMTDPAPNAAAALDSAHYCVLLEEGREAEADWAADGGAIPLAVLSNAARLAVSVAPDRVALTVAADRVFLDPLRASSYCARGVAVALEATEESAAGVRRLIFPRARAIETDAAGGAPAVTLAELPFRLVIAGMRGVFLGGGFTASVATDATTIIGAFGEPYAFETLSVRVGLAPERLGLDVSAARFDLTFPNDLYLRMADMTLAIETVSSNGFEIECVADAAPGADACLFTRDQLDRYERERGGVGERDRFSQELILAADQEIRQGGRVDVRFEMATLSFLTPSPHPVWPFLLNQINARDARFNIGLSQDAFTADTAAADVAFTGIATISDGQTVQGAAAVDRFAFATRLPLLASDQQQSIDLTVDLMISAMDEAMWSLLDPSGTLERGPIELRFDGALLASLAEDVRDERGAFQLDFSPIVSTGFFARDARVDAFGFDMTVVGDAAADLTDFEGARRMTVTLENWRAGFEAMERSSLWELQSVRQELSLLRSWAETAGRPTGAPGAVELTLDYKGQALQVNGRDVVGGALTPQNDQEDAVEDGDAPE